jgi:hypothetical protein
MNPSSWAVVQYRRQIGFGVVKPKPEQIRMRLIRVSIRAHPMT